MVEATFVPVEVPEQRVNLNMSDAEARALYHALTKRRDDEVYANGLNAVDSTWAVREALLFLLWPNCPVSAQEPIAP